MNPKIIKLNGKTYESQTFHTCEFCDLRDNDGECQLPVGETCNGGEYYELQND